MAQTTSEGGARLRRLMEAYADKLLRLCYLYLKDRALAEDAVQDTFLKAYRSFDQFRDESAEKTWLTRIAINTCKNYRRGFWHRLVDKKITPDDLPPAQYQPHERDDRVVVEIMKLSPVYREVILLYYYHEMSAPEIARLLNVPEATVFTRLRRARLRLRKELEEWYFHE